MTAHLFDAYLRTVLDPMPKCSTAANLMFACGTVLSLPNISCKTEYQVLPGLFFSFYFRSAALDAILFAWLFYRFGESMRKPLWTHGVASKVLRPRFDRAQKATPVVKMTELIFTTVLRAHFSFGDEKCGLEINKDRRFEFN